MNDLCLCYETPNQVYDRNCDKITFDMLLAWAVNVVYLLWKGYKWNEILQCKFNWSNERSVKAPQISYIISREELECRMFLLFWQDASKVK